MAFTSPTEINSLEDLKGVTDPELYAVISKHSDSIHLSVFPDEEWYLEAGVDFFGNDGDMTVENAFGNSSEWLLYGSLKKQGQSWKWVTSLKEMQFGSKNYSDYNPQFEENQVFAIVMSFILQDAKKIDNKLSSLGISGWNSIGISDTERREIIKFMLKK